MAFLDPPYNVAVRTIVGRGKAKHREFAMASGEMSRDDFVAFLKATLNQQPRSPPTAPFTLFASTGATSRSWPLPGAVATARCLI